MEDDQIIKVFNLRLINQVRIQTPCAPPVICIQDDMAIQYFNRVIVNVLIRLAHYIIVYRLIVNIRGCIKKYIGKNYKLKAPLSNTGTVGEEVGNMLRRGKRDVEVNYSGRYFFRPTTPNKEILHRFNITMPKEDIMHVIYGYVIFKAEIYHRKHM